MQDYDWNDLKLLLALHRLGTFAGVARSYGVSETTVARRLKQLEQALGIILFFKNDLGRYTLTSEAGVILAHAENMERESISLNNQLGAMNHPLSGTVRISSVPVIINRVLISQLKPFHSSYPAITLELFPESRNIDLTKREADLAIRFSRPASGGLAVKAQKLGTLEFGIFCATGISPEDQKNLSWIGYDDAHASLPQAGWIETLRKQEKTNFYPSRIADIDTAIEAVACGYGKSVLPIMVGLNDNRLSPCPEKSPQKPVKRDIWLLSHSSQSESPTISTVKNWLTELSWR